VFCKTARKTDPSELEDYCLKANAEVLMGVDSDNQRPHVKESSRSPFQLTAAINFSKLTSLSARLKL
jgi:hypothetical protein